MTDQLEYERRAFNANYQAKERTILAIPASFEDCMSNRAENHISWIATHTLRAWRGDGDGDGDSDPHQEPNMFVHWFFDNNEKTEWDRARNNRLASSTIYRLRVRPHDSIKNKFMLLDILERDVKDMALQKILDGQVYR